MVNPRYAIERRVAGRWIAGPSIEDAVALAKKANAKGISVLINYLGEDFVRRIDVSDAVETYMKLLEVLHISKIRADISVKPTQMGLKIGRELMESNYARIVESARSKGIFVWLDMEEQWAVDQTIAMYLKSVKKGNVGICIQAYLKRSHDDVVKIVRAKGIIRLVKGAYGLGHGTFNTKDEITESYRKLLEYLFDHSERFTVATHDPALMWYSATLNKRYHRHITYSMLNGINNKKALQIASEGENVALYVPFGTRWLAYSYRRLKEGGHLSLIVRSLFANQTV
jgi:proline dehydrogenase